MRLWALLQSPQHQRLVIAVSAAFVRRAAGCTCQRLHNKMDLDPQVDLSIINGEVVVRDGKLLTLDVDALMEEHNAVSQRICSHILPAKA